MQGADGGGAGQASLRFHFAGENVYRHIPVDGFSIFVSCDYPVRVAVEAQPDVCAAPHDFFRHGIGVKRAAALVYEGAVVRCEDGEDFRPQPRKDFGRGICRGAVRAVQHDAQPVKASRGGADGGFVTFGQSCRAPHLAAVLRVTQFRVRDVLFHERFPFPCELSAVGPENFYAVVARRIVRRAHHHARGRPRFPCHEGHARGGHNAEVNYVARGGEHAFRKRTREIFAAGAVVAAYDDGAARGGKAEAVADKHCKPVRQVFAVDAANAVRPEIFSGFRKVLHSAVYSVRAQGVQKERRKRFFQTNLGRVNFLKIFCKNY